jgi:hypothetical protein
MNIAIYRKKPWTLIRKTKDNHSVDYYSEPQVELDTSALEGLVWDLFILLDEPPEDLWRWLLIHEGIRIGLVLPIYGDYDLKSWDCLINKNKL